MARQNLTIKSLQNCRLFTHALKGLAQTLNLLPGTIPGKAKEEEDNQDDENPPKPPSAEGLTLGRSWHDFYTSFA
ncbi:MAG: hypothetical protein ACPLRH_05355 [Desulfotomaculales bacterium]